GGQMRQLPRNNVYAMHAFDGTGEEVHYDLLLEPLATTALFAPYRVRAVSGNLPGVETDSDEGLFMRVPAFRRLRSEAFSEIPKIPRPIKDSVIDETIPPEIQSRYLQLPIKMDPKVRTLAQDITSGFPSFIEKASAVEAYLKKNYKYTLQLTWDPGEQPISTFLFKAKAGHCEY